MPLLALPAEIRLTIFELALPRGEVYEYDTFLNSNPNYLRTVPKRTRDYPGLLTVSKQVRAETAPMFFKIYTIKIMSAKGPTKLTSLPTKIRSQAGFAESSYKYIRNFKIAMRTCKPLGHQSSGGGHIACDDSQIGCHVGLSKGIMRGKAWESSSHSFHGDGPVCCTEEAKDLLKRYCTEMLDALKAVLGGVSGDIVVEESVWPTHFSQEGSGIFVLYLALGDVLRTAVRDAVIKECVWSAHFPYLASEVHGWGVAVGRKKHGCNVDRETCNGMAWAVASYCVAIKDLRRFSSV
jgi:hypothetical protein